ncbi:MAG: CRISPR-associated protein Cas4 [Candidatus Aenigmarchaeota archaeon]|nr:CRISPR-associated protein Cas4 [Candidatus Aenigmarchaeota archaeon]
MEIPKKASITGVQVAYYVVCRRKLWLFTHQISMEQTSEKVKLGKLLHETSYKRKTKEIGIDNIKIDFMERKGEIHEIKKSRKIEKAHEYQMFYYLYYLKKKGIVIKGIIDYPLLKQRIEVLLTPEKEEEVEEMLNHIKAIREKELPPEAKVLPYCKSCSYYNFCWC